MRSVARPSRHSVRKTVGDRLLTQWSSRKLMQVKEDLIREWNLTSCLDTSRGPMSFWFKILLFLPESSDDMPQFCRDDMVLLKLGILESIDLVRIGSICSVYRQGQKCHITHQAQMPAAFRFLEIVVEEDYYVAATAQFRKIIWGLASLCPTIGDALILTQSSWIPRNRFQKRLTMRKNEFSVEVEAK